MAELLSIPLKKSTDVDIVKPLKNLIQSTYSTSETTEDYTEALTELARLRSNAIWKVADPSQSSLDALYNYYDQLEDLEKKIPPQEVQIPFKWKDAFDKGSIFGGRMSLTVPSLSFERVCVLFNMGALATGVAAREAAAGDEGLRAAARLLQAAAGVFLRLRAAAPPALQREPTPDLSPDALAALAALALAQAQEVIVHKSIKDEMKESMVARVCSACEDLYAEAARALSRDHLKPLWDREWIPTVTMKQQAFHGLTQLYQSRVCHASGEVGEELARLQVAVQALAGAARAGPLVAEAAARAGRLRDAALRDNDFIYHAPVPAAAALSAVPRAQVARPAEPPARWGAGPALFASLVPLCVAQAQSALAARRAEAVGALVGELRAGTAALNAALAERGLPAALEGGALPAALAGAGAAVRAAGGAPALQAALAELPAALQRNRDVLAETRRLLTEEEEADAALRRQFGARWSRTESRALTAAFHANLDKYEQIIDNAVKADLIVQQKYEQHKESIEVLSGSESALGAGLPAAEGGGASGGELRELRRVLDEVEAVKAERDALEAQLQAVSVDLREEFTAAWARAGSVDEPALSAAALGGRARRARRRRARRAAAAGPRARPPRCRTRHLHGPHQQPQGGRQVLQRPHAVAGDVPEQGDGLLLRAQHGEGGPAQTPDAGGVAARRPRADGGSTGGPPAAPAPRGARVRSRSRARARCRCRSRHRARLCRHAALSLTTTRHAAAVGGGPGLLRRAPAGRVQPLRYAALPAPRAPAPRPRLPTLPVPAPRRLPRAARARVLPLPARAAAVTTHMRYISFHKYNYSPSLFQSRHHPR